MVELGGGGWDGLQQTRVKLYSPCLKKYLQWQQLGLYGALHHFPISPVVYQHWVKAVRCSVPLASVLPFGKKRQQNTLFQCLHMVVNSTVIPIYKDCDVQHTWNEPVTVRPSYPEAFFFVCNSLTPDLFENKRRVIGRAWCARSRPVSDWTPSGGKVFCSAGTGSSR